MFQDERNWVRFWSLFPNLLAEDQTGTKINILLAHSWIGVLVDRYFFSRILGCESWPARALNIRVSALGISQTG